MRGILLHLLSPINVEASSESSVIQPNGDRNANEIDHKKPFPHGSVLCGGVDIVHGECEDRANTGIVRMRSSLRFRVEQDNRGNQRETEANIKLKLRLQEFGNGQSR